MTTTNKPKVVGSGATGEVSVNAAKKYRAGTPGVNFHTGARQVTKKIEVSKPTKNTHSTLKIVIGSIIVLLLADMVAWFVFWSPLLTKLEHWW